MSASTPTTSKTDQSGSLLIKAVGFGLVGFYAVFTLLPNSNSLMVKWPWVFLWQFGLMLCPVALLFQLWRGKARRLGGWLDWLAAAWCIALTLSATFAEFKHQAFWYSWAAICGIAALYAINSWLTSKERVQRLLTFQGGLTILFSLSSLVAWYFQTVRPYQANLAQLKSYGIERSLDLQSIPLRNWHPIGHQNYVAGYLVLIIPLLVGLALSENKLKRVGWVLGALVSLVVLYSTASRGGWLGIVVSTVVFVGLSIWQYPKFRRLLVSTGLLSFGGIVVWGFSSDRIRGLFTAFSGDVSNSELFYRVITNVTGWRIGLEHPILGAGLGSVTLLYQKYRPEWAGREAELTYQLHSTPAQLWAELGVAGALLTFCSLAVIVYLSIRWCKRETDTTEQQVAISPLIVSLISGLAGYITYAITDYQLDNICISGALAIFLAVLIFENRSRDSQGVRESSTVVEPKIRETTAKKIALLGTGILTAISIWLYPIHKAWMLSSQGFLALQQQDIASFVTYLERANQLAPWEPYYAYQLAWNLGELAYKSENAQQQEALRQASIQWFEKAIKISPNQEFGYSNLGWLQVNSEPDTATQNFLKATQLVPGKRGTSFALGYSLLKEGKSNLALQAMVSELLQQPILLTSPVWESPELAAFYSQVVERFADKLYQQVNQTSDNKSKSYYFQVLGSLNWWEGNFNKARMDFEQVPTLLNESMMVLAQARLGEEVEIKIREETAAKLAATAWQSSRDREQLLLKALLLSSTSELVPTADYLQDIVAEIQTSAQQSKNFHSWVSQNSPSRQVRNQRLGFGTVSRHIDGPLPNDFYTKSENVIMTQFFEGFFPTSTFAVSKASI